MKIAVVDTDYSCTCRKSRFNLCFIMSLKGLIAPDFPYLAIAKEYEDAGADCISCLTEPHWFLGSDEYLKEITAAVAVPVIRKDFTVSEYQIYEAKLLGASAVLLICALLDTKTIREYIEICDSLGISALVEAHDEAEVKSALAAGARIIGVNNRIASASVLTDSSGFSAILFSYLFLVKSAISFNIVLLICYPDKFLKLSCRLAAVYYILCLLHCICKRYFALSRNVNTCTCIKYNCCTLSSS